MKKKFTLFLLALLLIQIALPVFTSVAATEQHSNVLDDLQKDRTFDASAYPDNPEDYSLQVIQIAEGENGELFIYVYQPSNATRDYRARYINMALQDSIPSNTDEPLNDLYSLTWLNSNGVFDKYIVDKFTALTEESRYYNITAIYRDFDEDVDDKAEAVDSKQCIGYPVGQRWSVYDYNDTLLYYMDKIDYVDVDYVATGSVRYNNGFKFYVNACDAHYIAFNVVGYNVQKIYDVDITYKFRSVTWNFIPGKGESSGTGEWVSVTRKLTDIEQGSNKGDGFFGKVYTWDRIEKSEDFIKRALDEANEDSFGLAEHLALTESQFVISFLETDYNYNSYTSTGVVQETSYETAWVGLLRIHFLSEGKHYNLGVVSDLVGTDTTPELKVTISDNFENENWWQKIIALLVIILIVVVLGPFITPFFTVLFSLFLSGLKYLIKFIVWLLLLPFRWFLR